MPVLSEDEFARRATKIEWLLCDSDGVLTDGGLFYGPRGPNLLRFDVRDGMGIRLAQRAGLKVGVLSARGSRALERRAAELDLEPIVTASTNKAGDFGSFLERQEIRAQQVAFIGDDLTDLVVLSRCGLSFAPADAVPEVQAIVHRILATRGGHGVVREMIEVLLKARGEWEKVLSPFTFEAQ
jgi:3-deoxy-D-manno-octulosonate 8-phosphate phosphatase (KDO 8-P phosphatase)